MMDLETALRHDLHGELLGRNGGIVCDYMPPHREAIDPTGRICYEAVRVVVSPTLDGRLTIPDGWHLDAARCADHAVTRLPYRTAGFDEALLALEVVPVEGIAHAVDGASIRVLDRSPPDEGGQPVEAPPALADEAVKREDYGYDRLLRQAVCLPVWRHLGHDGYVSALTTSMDRDDRARGEEPSTSMRG